MPDVHLCINKRIRRMKCGLLNSWIRGQAGFSVVELVIVLALIVVLTTLSVPAFNKISGSGALSSSGNLVVNMANLARTQAIARNTMTALVVATDRRSHQAYRTMAVFELAPTQDGGLMRTTDWRLVSKWEVLQRGIIVDIDLTFNDKTDSASTPGVPFPMLPDIQIGGQPVESYRYIVFMPSGYLLSGQSESLNLKEGYIIPNTTDPQYKNTSNKYDITILASTGRVIVSRP